MVRGVGTARRIMRRLSRWSQPRALVLIYHRVAELPLNPQSLAVSPEHFAEHLAVLRDRSRPMRLLELVQYLREGCVPHRAVVVTFDDGYADNLATAEPLLRRYDVPATVFVTAGCLGQEQEFWWDELDRLLLRPGTLPPVLEVTLGGRTHRWDLGDAARYDEDASHRHRGWSVHAGRDPTSRHRLYRWLLAALRPLPEVDRQQVRAALRAWAGDPGGSRATHRVLSAAELPLLEEGGLIDIGAHAYTHQVLATLPVAEQRREIAGSRERLEEIVAHPVRSFAYPFGAPVDYGIDAVALVRDAYFDCACTVVASPVWNDTDAYQLPRLHAGDWPAHVFARRLERWFRG